ncbi:hypothetical protein [Lichenicoccus roseus]|uniref:Uncharacterized protein n=1 Tax=Lichenicoccus roseus TaxID=2683649 RepID=A0A5R9J7F9_9PROT|nr:hypothetical protein [Lichenicoccus roseus]TLU73535.1 hypothetical protein FE263_09200 [Lichenicoccus roseus]
MSDTAPTSGPMVSPSSSRRRGQGAAGPPLATTALVGHSFLALGAPDYDPINPSFFATPFDRAGIGAR